MAKHIQTLKTRRIGILSRVSEMIGKIAPLNDFMRKNSITWQLYTTAPSVDYSKTNYALCRSIFYASVIAEGGTHYGEDFLLGASFGKPIVNSAAAFAFGQSPYISIEQEKQVSKTQVNDDVSKVEAKGSKVDLEYTENFVADWLSSHESEIFKTCRNTLRDGDQYLLINDDLSVTMIPPEQVEIIDNKLTGEILGYNVSVYVQEPDSNGNDKGVKYVSEYRKIAPFFKLMRYADDSKTGQVIKMDIGNSTLDKNNNIIAPVVDEGEEFVPEIRELSMIGFHNERDARERYGNSEYQSVYTLMANYHAVLEGAIKNNIYNSGATPIIKGIDDQNAWLEANGVKDSSTGEYSMSWDKNKLLVGGKDFDVKIIESTGTSTDASNILNLLFWLICQTSETPEFVMGTAVASSNASVDSQMPVVLRKAARKQKEFRQFFEQLVRVLLNKASLTDTQIVKDVKFRISYPDVVGEDMKLNIEIVKLLSEQGCITDKTKMEMLGMGDVVDDIDKEVEEAHAEGEAKSQVSIDQMAKSRGDTSPQANADQGDEIVKKKSTKTKVAKEMDESVSEQWVTIRGRHILIGGGGSGSSGGGSSKGGGGGGVKASDSEGVVNPNGTDTFERYTDKNGKFSPERAALHEQIINKAMEGRTPVDNPVSYMLGGGPATGKSTIVKQGKAFKNENVVLSNADDLMSELPDYKFLVKKNDTSAAAYAHEEGSYLSKLLLKEASSKNYNVALDGTGNNSIAKLSEKIKDMSPNGQPVKAIYTTMPTSSSIKLSNERAIKTGRKVPEDVLKTTHKGVSTVFPEAVSQNLFDEFSLYETSIWEKPRLIISGGKGMPTVIKEKGLYQDFLDKATETL